jgi:hypothetical protein
MNMAEPLQFPNLRGELRRNEPMGTILLLI